MILLILLGSGENNKHISKQGPCPGPEGWAFWRFRGSARLGGAKLAGGTGEVWCYVPHSSPLRLEHPLDPDLSTGLYIRTMVARQRFQLWHVQHECAS